MYKIPKLFYVKLAFILSVLVVVGIQQREMIGATLARSELTTFQKITTIVQETLGVPVQEPQSVEEVHVTTSVVPRTLDVAVTQTALYQEAQQVAVNFNQNIDMTALNQHLIAQIQSQKPDVMLGAHLEYGANQRAIELSEYHYLGNQTLSGESFRSLFPLEASEYRLSEQLYEVYVSARDVHLTTWQNEAILADYIIKLLSENNAGLQHSYASQYVSIQAAASDYSVGETPYVRLVIVLITDTY